MYFSELCGVTICETLLFIKKYNFYVIVCFVLIVQSSKSFCLHSFLSLFWHSKPNSSTDISGYRLTWRMWCSPLQHHTGRQLLLHACQACSLLFGTPCIWLVAAVSNFPWDALCLRAASPLLRCHGNHCYSASEPHLPPNNVCMCLWRYWFLGYL
jgi:hypothetical protein